MIFLCFFFCFVCFFLCCCAGKCLVGRNPIAHEWSSFPSWPDHVGSHSSGGTSTERAPCLGGSHRPRMILASIVAQSCMSVAIPAVEPPPSGYLVGRDSIVHEWSSFSLRFLPVPMSVYIHIYIYIFSGQFWKNNFFENFKVLCFWHFDPHFFWQVPTNGNHVLCVFFCSLFFTLSETIIFTFPNRFRCQQQPALRMYEI